MMLTFSIALAFLLGVQAAAFQQTVSNLSTEANETEKFLKTGSRPHESSELPSSFRLSEDTVPKAYNLKLFPNLQTFHVTGEVVIEVQVRNATHTITLHAASSLNVSSVALFKKDEKKNVTIISVTRDDENQLLSITASSELNINDIYQLDIGFHYKLMKRISFGFFGGEYLDGKIKKSYATTQFEPYYARAAFPCYDEPGFRTPFTISLARYRHEISRSNMPLKSTSEPDPLIDNRVWDTFHTTLSMPTYLIAFMVSELASISEPNKKFTTYARKAMIEDTRYALEESQVLMEAMEKYIGVNYSLPKMDLVAVPHPELLFEGMENWGFVTFEEDVLLTNPDVCPTSASEKTTTVIAHEFAHQWFGDIITPTWWSYTWLNEGFAGYFQYFLTAAVKPSWQMDQLFVMESMHSVMGSEDDLISHPLNANVRRQRDIPALFDSISYYKGASILRMLEHMVTSPVFRKALNKYVMDGRMKGGSVTPYDLWNAVEKQVNWDRIELNLPSPKTITTVMETWTDQVGYPVVTVSREKGTKNVIIYQEPYSAEWGNTEWIIPLTYTKQSSSGSDDTFPMKWLLPGENVTIEVGENEWILLNLQQTGYYRVNYDRDNWQLLINQLNTNPQRIHVLNRAQLLDDCIHLPNYKIELTTICTQLLNYLKKETDIIPWFPVLKILPSLKRFMDLDSSFNIPGLTAEDLNSILDAQFDLVGFHPKQDDSHLRKTSRIRFLKSLCSSNHTACVQSAMKEYKKHENDLNKIDPDLKYVVFCTMLQQTKGNEFNHISRAIKNSFGNAPKLCEINIYAPIGYNCISDYDQRRRYFSSDSDTKYKGVISEFPSLKFSSSFLNPLDKDVSSQARSNVSLKNGTDLFKSNSRNHNQRKSILHSLTTETDSQIFTRRNPKTVRGDSQTPLRIRHEKHLNYESMDYQSNNVDSPYNYNDEDHMNNHKPMFTNCSSYHPSIKEEEPTGIFVIQVHATDRDPLLHGGSINYSLVQAEPAKFRIDTHTGVITTKWMFNRDEPAREREEYVTVRATDNGKPQLDDVCQFKVVIEDVNDNSPTFNKVSYEESIPQDLKLDSEVMRISATDIDDGENRLIEYELHENTSAKYSDRKYFGIDKKTGIIKLNREILDKEPGYMFKIRASATDKNPTNPITSYVELVIKVVASDKKPPYFTDVPPPVILLKENFADHSKRIATFTANSNTEEAFPRFSLVPGKSEQTNKNTFRLETKDNHAFLMLGAITLDYEELTEYTLTVRAENKHNLAAEHSVTIQLEDVNDNFPKFSVVSGSVLENEPPGTPVMQVNARDMDITPIFRKVTYWLLDHESEFHIDPDTGNITTRVTFDREQQDVYNVKVQAEDGAPSAFYSDGSHNTATKVFKIEIADRNDHPPKFEHQNYEADIPENADLDSPVTEVHANDRDSASTIVYSIVDGNIGDAFYIEPITGKIKVKEHLDYESVVSYTLKVKAFDGLYLDECTVNINVSNVNDNPPKFLDFDRNVTIREEEMVSGCITTVKAFDPDIADQSLPQRIVYKVVKEDQQKFLTINETGCLSLLKPLARDPPYGYSLWQVLIQANDEGGASTTPSTTEVWITLIDTQLEMC